MSPAPESPLIWTDGGQPRSSLYGDVFFSAADGLAEARAVFLDGCGLPEAWRERDRFVVGELGFGTGLNILALMDLWRRERPPGARLHIFTVEAHPLAAADAKRALAAWPELDDLATTLLDLWPVAVHGFHRIEPPGQGVIIDIAHMEVAEALSAWTGRADAWFLDGFSPALNPAMWRDEVIRLVAARSAPGAAAATFTVAGDVRRRLAAAGFAVAKRPGFGRKRERLEARLAGEAPASLGQRVAIIGAGIAGAAAARAVRALGGEAVVIESEAPGAGASGNPGALVTPRLDAGLGPPARLFAQAFARATQLYAEQTDAVLAKGVLQLEGRPADATRFEAIAGSGLFEPGGLERLTAQAMTARMGEPASAGLDLPTALVVDPVTLISAWLGEAVVATVARLTRDGDGWSLRDAAGAVITRADAVILAAGPDAAALVPGLPLSPVRGQASWTEGGEGGPAATWGGYVLPTRKGVLFGATHDRGETATDVRTADHDRNLATLAAAAPGLAARLRGAPLAGRASIRAVTADYLPLAGQAPGADPGLFVLAGLGGRGFTLAPLLAEHVAALALGAPSPLPATAQALVDPGRFALRAARRGHSNKAEARLSIAHEGGP